MKLPSIYSKPVDDVKGFINKELLPHLRQVAMAVGGRCYVGRAAESATTPGPCVAKLEVFDKDGNSLGFVAVYSAIA